MNEEMVISLQIGQIVTYCVSVSCLVMLGLVYLIRKVQPTIAWDVLTLQTPDIQESNRRVLYTAGKLFAAMCVFMTAFNWTFCRSTYAETQNMNWLVIGAAVLMLL